MDVRKTVLVGHSAEQMFDLIEACEHYPDFLPWCSGATVVARDENTVVADIRVNYHGVRFEFRTRNPKRRPTAMTIHLERGPFRHFDGVWDLTPLAADGCRIDFGLRYDFHSTAMARIARPVFDRIANTLVDRFVTQADRVYPRGGTVSSAGTRTEAQPSPPGSPTPTAPTPAPEMSTRTVPEPGFPGNSDGPFYRSTPS
jgi:ribosome-associated toxin RatA of RatAB toxin-antitoxin module